MIKRTMKDVNYLVQNELDMACETHGDKFNSGHEAYAVIKEEVEELEAEVKLIQSTIDYMWWDIKYDDPYGDRLEEIEKYATRAACEAIQVSAMARKAMR